METRKQLILYNEEFPWNGHVWYFIVKLTKYTKKWLHTQPKVSNTITIGKQQRKCRTHQILLVFPAVLTQLFWLPLSVNHLHITNLIQHFFTECFQVSTQYTGMGHTVISRHYLGGGGLHSKPKTLHVYDNYKQKADICSALSCLHSNPCKFSDAQQILLSQFHQLLQLGLTRGQFRTEPYTPPNRNQQLRSTCAPGALHKNAYYSPGNSLCVHQQENGLKNYGTALQLNST